jgi:hypothetical protein
MCERIEKEYGGDTPVTIQIRDDDGRLMERDQCVHAFLKQYGELVLSNYKNKT